jgi:hypothetical protein
MPLSLDILKKRLAIPPDDLSKDDAITQTAAVAQALCEDYCDRKFDLEPDEETFFGRGSIMLVRRWPIARDPPPEITGPEGEAVAWGHWAVDYEKGMIASPDYWWRGAKVAYVGGWDPWPPALTWAVQIAFDVLWAEEPGGGIPPGPPVGSGSTGRYSVVGAFSIESKSGGIGEAGANEGEGWGPLPGPVVRALETYRRESRIGAG